MEAWRWSTDDQGLLTSTRHEVNFPVAITRRLSPDVLQRLVCPLVESYDLPVREALPNKHAVEAFLTLRDYNADCRTWRDLVKRLASNGSDHLWISASRSGNWHHLENQADTLSDGLKIVAVVPHFACEIFLRRCLFSLVAQTRALDAIVVVHDGPTSPPVEIVQEFPTVTLLQSSVKSSPGALLQAVIESTSADAYLMQDADDWSAIDRLQTLLPIVASGQADFVGSHEMRVSSSETEMIPVTYPLDVNFALRQGPIGCFLHGSSLLTRSALTEIGGLSAGTAFGHDSELLQRAAYTSYVMNVDHILYFRSLRPDSLSASANTGYGSARRSRLAQQLFRRELKLRESLRSCQRLDLRPLWPGSRPQLHRVLGRWPV